jgi:hypothetical protein
MRTILLSSVLLFGCAGDQYLKGKNNAKPQETEIQEPSKPVALSSVQIGLWLSAFGILGYSAWKWMTTESSDQTTV